MYMTWLHRRKKLDKLELMNRVRAGILNWRDEKKGKDCLHTHRVKG